MSRVDKKSHIHKSRIAYQFIKTRKLSHCNAICIVNIANPVKLELVKQQYQSNCGVNAAIQKEKFLQTA